MAKQMASGSHFSSPEHKVLRVSYCDTAVSVVHRVSSAFLACVCSRGHIIMKLGQNVCLDEISDKCKEGSCQSKTRSLGQILEKPCVCCRGHIFSPIIMKLVQNVCLDKFLDKFENGSCRSKIGYYFKS